jgi:ElaB/YqjD/DUF883 family membrane-anchored ribosome-binding protein
MATTTPADFPTSSTMGDDDPSLAGSGLPGASRPPMSSSTASMGTEADFGTSSGGPGGMARAGASGDTTGSGYGTGSGGMVGAGGMAGTASGAGGSDLMNRVVQGAHATIDRLAETAAPVVERWSGNVSQAGGSLQQQADRVREMGDEWAESLRTTVRENPLASVGIALAIGLIVARLSR